MSSLLAVRWGTALVGGRRHPRRPPFRGRSRRVPRPPRPSATARAGARDNCLGCDWEGDRSGCRAPDLAPRRLQGRGRRDAGGRWGLAPEQGQGAGQAPGPGPREAAAPRAADGRALARPGPRGGRRQPPQGRLLRPPGAGPRAPGPARRDAAPGGGPPLGRRRRLRAGRRGRRPQGRGRAVRRRPAARGPVRVLDRGAARPAPRPLRPAAARPRARAGGGRRPGRGHGRPGAAGRRRPAERGGGHGRHPGPRARRAAPPGAALVPAVRGPAGRGARR